MMKRIDIKMVLATLLCVVVGVGMITGNVQQHIVFADALNEIVFTAMAFMLAVGMAMNIKRS